MPAALLAPTVLALLTTTFTDPDERGRAFGIYGALAGAGGALGISTGGILTLRLVAMVDALHQPALAASATAGALLWLKNDKGAARPVGPARCVPSGRRAVPHSSSASSHAETTAWSNPFTIGFPWQGWPACCVRLFETRAKYHPPTPGRAQPNQGGSNLAMLLPASDSECSCSSPTTCRTLWASAR